MASIESSRAVRYHRHFLILLVLCCLLSPVLAVPATRSFKSINAYSSIQDTVAVPLFLSRRNTMESNLGEGRMDIELNDYPGPGANKGHEPVTPSKP